MKEGGKKKKKGKYFRDGKLPRWGLTYLATATTASRFRQTVRASPPNSDLGQHVHIQTERTGMYVHSRAVECSIPLPVRFPWTALHEVTECSTNPPSVYRIVA